MSNLSLRKCNCSLSHCSFYLFVLSLRNNADASVVTILIEIFILSCTFYHLENKREKEISHASSTSTFIGDPGAIWLLIVFHFQHID